MIKQGKVSTSVGFKFLEKYNLEKYNNPDKPAIFFGCYSRSDVNIILNHKSLAIMVWRGTDAQVNHKNKLKRKNIKHVAIGGFIADDLRKAGIEFKRLPIRAGENIPDPQPLGNHIYCYTPRTRYDFYGGKIIDKLKKWLFNEKFIVTLSPRQYSKEQIIELYKKCFIGLRLTPHDGLPNTVIELGLMGRRCIYNGDLPNAINWKNIQDIIRIIKVEKTMIGQTNIQLANAMANYLNIDDSWLNENYWL